MKSRKEHQTAETKCVEEQDDNENVSECEALGQEACHYMLYLEHHMAT